MSRVRKPLGGSSRGSGLPPACVDFVAASMRQGNSRVAAADGGQLGRKINEPMRDEVDHLALSLDASAHGDHAGAHHDAAKLLEHLRPDHQVGDAGLVLQGDEHHALGAAGPLPNKDEARRL